MTRDQFIEISKWQDETFGRATALSKIHHLAEEIIELMQELNPLPVIYQEGVSEDNGGYTPGEPDEEANKIAGLLREVKIRKEFADCFLLLFGAAASHGYTFEEITVSGLCVVALSINLKLTTTLDRAITQSPCYVPLNFKADEKI